MFAQGGLDTGQDAGRSGEQRGKPVNWTEIPERARCTVSVGLPVHNGAATILESLQSLARQTFADAEFFVFENASTDDTRKIVEEFCRTDPRFHCVPSGRLLPVVENFARARRFLAGRSKYLLLLAADDAINDDFLTHAVAALEAEPHAALAVPKVAGKHARGSFLPVNRDVLDLATYGRFGRGFRQIAFPPSWFYGLYRSDVAQERIDEAFRLFPDA
nr:glycosyltransferase family 2 protein [Rhodobacter amnigenus]